AARRHAVDDGADELDRRDHVLDDAGQDGVAVEIVEIAARRAAIVVDENIDLGTGGEEGALDVRRADIAGDGGDADLETSGEIGGGRLEGGGVAAVDDEIAAGFGERHGATAPEATAGGADDRLPPGNAQVHAEGDRLRRQP